MADKDHDNIDFDELDELPDVVLGDETRAIRTIHENGGTTEEIRALQAKKKTALDKVSEPEPEIDEEEISASLLDDDPAVDDELSGLFDDEGSRPEDKGEQTEEVPVIKDEPAVKEEAEPDQEDTQEITTGFPAFDEEEEEADSSPVTESPADAIDANTTAMRTMESDLESYEQEHTATMGIPLYLHNPGTGTIHTISEEAGEHRGMMGSAGKMDPIEPKTPKEGEKAEPETREETKSESYYLSEELFGNTDEAVQVPGTKKEDVISLPEEEQKTGPAAKEERDTRDDLTKVVARAEEDEKKAELRKHEIPSIDEKSEKETANQAKKKKRRLRKPVKRILVWILLILLLIVMGMGIYGIWKKTQPVSSLSEQVPFQVAENATLKSVSQQLEEQGIVQDGQMVYLYGRAKKLTDIKHGAFTLDKSWTIDHILRDLNDETKGLADSAYVTIVEGEWAKDAAKKFAASTNVSAEDLLALWNNETWIRSQMSTYPFLTDEMFKDGVRIYLEGYLAPDTYLVKQKTTPEEITTQILDETLKIYDQNKDAIAASGHSVHEIYTLASLVQYEASDPVDMAKIASVSYNRLSAGMPLQYSVTVCYAIDFDKMEDDWQACEVNADFESPYNTYKYQGLPPGAIENAGQDALNAVLHPADTDYLYFMADVLGDRTIYYATTLEEHNANVAKYLKQ